MRFLITDLSNKVNPTSVVKTDNNTLIPVCAWCKKTRSIDQQWHHLDLTGHERKLTHTICPDCNEGLLDDFQPKKTNSRNQLTLTVSWQVLNQSTIAVTM
ncbi:hypothetical protein QUF58_07450 [Anaerolineales bacterium HSG24]|nr:hypothetical protein [Anaerolineales bacterium HSG24]